MVDMVVIKRQRFVISLAIGVSPGTPGIFVTLRVERETSWRLRFLGLAERSGCGFPICFPGDAVGECAVGGRSAGEFAVGGCGADELAAGMDGVGVGAPAGSVPTGGKVEEGLTHDG